MFLSPAELQTLTGYRRPSKQLAWLKRARVPYYLSRGGRPVVLRSDLEHRRIPANGPAPYPRLRIATSRLQTG